MSSSIAQSLGRMVSINQFIVWCLNWDEIENKYKKYPVNPSNPIIKIDGGDPKNWLSFAEAYRQTSILNSQNTNNLIKYTSGFYFTSDCGYWFLDIDNAVVDKVVTPVASHIYSQLHQCAFEWSSSGRGMHFFGKGKLPIDRKIKPSGSGLELYDRDRGAAFGLTGVMSGCADANIGNVMVDIIIPTYFKSDDNHTGIFIGDDFDHPREDYYCVSDDAELLMRMRQSMSIASKFDFHKATFSDLYDGNFKVLEIAYGGDDSAYDLALASHLAFWTGCDAPRIERFMRSSALYRPKWDDIRRKSYLREHTINKACAMQANVLQDRKPISSQPTEIAKEIDPDTSAFAGKEVQLQLFKNCVYVTELHKIFMPLANGGFRLLSGQQFDAQFARFIFKLDDRNEASSFCKSAFDTFLSSKLINYPKVDLIKFDPFRKPFTVFINEGVSYLNSYCPTPIAMLDGDASRFIDLVTTLFPAADDAKIILCWMAACVQHKGVKFRWSPILQGEQGCGKSLILDCLAYAIGSQFVAYPTSDQLTKEFNSWLDQKLLVVINEFRQSGKDKKLEDKLKMLITEPYSQVEPKGKEQKIITNYANFAFTLNDKLAFKKANRDRRYCMLYSAVQTPDELLIKGLTESYFVDFVDWLNQKNGMAIVANYLHTYVIDPCFNPAKDCIRAPTTSNDAEIFDNAKSGYQMRIEDAIMEGEHGFKGGWICLQRLKKLFENKISNQKASQILTDMGFLPHGGLDNGWTNNGLAEDYGKRVRLFCTQEVINNTLKMSNSELTKRYQDAQFLM